MNPALTNLHHLRINLIDNHLNRNIDRLSAAAEKVLNDFHAYSS